VSSLKNVKKPLVLLCFRSKMLKNRWFYCVFAQNCGKVFAQTWWKPGGNLVETWWKLGGNLVETWWKPGGNLV